MENFWTLIHCKSLTRRHTCAYHAVTVCWCSKVLRHVIFEWALSWVAASTQKCINKMWVMLFWNRVVKTLSANPTKCTAQKMKFSIKDFFSKCDQTRAVMVKHTQIIRRLLLFLLHGNKGISAVSNNFWSSCNGNYFHLKIPLKLQVNLL